MKKVLLSLAVVVSLLSCTDNARARHWGGNEVVELPTNHKFINATWKDAQLWIVSQDTITGVFYLKEKSQFGMMEGSIEFK